MRKATGAIVCPRCERLIGAGEKKCPYCGAWQPGMFGYGPVLQRWFRGKFDLTRAITVACVALYVLSLALDPGAIFRWNGIFDILAPSSNALLELGMTGASLQRSGLWWTVLTAVFLHGSVLHILFNMLFLSRYMPQVVELFGPVRSFLIFMAAGIGGFVVSNFAGVSSTIGASGGLFGLLAALIVYGRRTGQSHITNQLWGSAIMMVLFSFMMSGVNNWAHGGGFAAGFVAAEALRFSHERDSPLEVALAGLLLVATLGGIVMSFLVVRGLVPWGR